MQLPAVSPIADPPNSWRDPPGLFLRLEKRKDLRLVEVHALNYVIHVAPPGTHILIDAQVGRETVALRVSDDGPGIAADMLPHVFDKFVHARAAQTGAADGGEGTGLGLTIA